MRKDEFPLIDAYADSKVNEVLDKIRAEIIERFGDSQCAEECGCLYELLEVIDKYRTENEVEK